MAPKNRTPVKPIEPESGSSEYETDTSGSDSDSKTPINNNNKPIAEPKNSESKKPITKTESNNAPDDSTNKVVKWSDVDDITILSEMIEFEANNNVSPNSNMDAFYDFINKNLNVVVTKNQLKDRVRRIKKKYEDSKGKDKNVMNGNEKPVFELSEKVWDGKPIVALSAVGNAGNVNESVSVVKKTPSRKRKAVENGKKDGALENKKKATGVNDKKDGTLEMKEAVVGNKIGLFDLSNEERWLRIGTELFERDEDIEGSEEWRKLLREEMEISIKKLDIKRARMRLVLDAMEK